VITVFVVDDHPALREGLSALLTVDDDLSVVGDAGTAEDALPAIERLGPEVVLLDVRLPGMDGVEACRALAERQPQVKVSIFTGLRDQPTMMKAFAAGAKGYVVKEAMPDTIRHAVRVVASGGMFIDPYLAGKLVSAASHRRGRVGPYGLTHQERRVLELLPEGLSNRQIAKALDLSPNTVKTHLRNAMRKLQVSDRSLAAAFVTREGLG
jgi:DNA-binding NarL/FixJ family response regulator